MKISVNGVELFVEVFGSKLAVDGATVAERPTVIALHGGPSDHAHMMSMIAPLTEVAQVVLYDQRGCGRSEHGDPTLWRMEQWADDVRGVCDVLGIEKPIVFGHSFGGMVAQMYAIRHPGRALGLIFSGTCSRFDVKISAEGFRRQGGDAAADAWTAFVDEPTPESTSGFVKYCRHLYTISRTPNPDLEARTITNIPLLFDFFNREAKLFDVTKGLAKVTTPVLILGGDEDPVLPPECQDEIEAALTNAPTQRFSFPHCGHTLGADAPEALSAALVNWVTSLS
jgi:pimeloyl-ACP methyl ester carboxylesterase